MSVMAERDIEAQELADEAIDLLKSAILRLSNGGYIEYLEERLHDEYCMSWDAIYEIEDKLF